MDNGTIVLEILRNLSDDDAYTLIDVFENHNDDEECIKEFNKVVDKIQNVVNKLDSNFLTNFKDKEELAYFTYCMVMDYHSNDLTQEKIDKSLDFFRKNKMSESSNKYIKSFREAIEKLEEDDGNPSLLQAMNYDVDNDEMEYDDRFKDLYEHIFDVYDEAYNLYHRDYNDNKKVEKVVNLLYTAWKYLRAEYKYKDLYRNEFVNKPYYDDEPEYDLQNADYDYLNK